MPNWPHHIAEKGADFIFGNSTLLPIKADFYRHFDKNQISKEETF